MNDESSKRDKPVNRLTIEELNAEAAKRAAEDAAAIGITVARLHEIEAAIEAGDSSKFTDEEIEKVQEVQKQRTREVMDQMSDLLDAMRKPWRFTSGFKNNFKGTFDLGFKDLTKRLSDSVQTEPVVHENSPIFEPPASMRQPYMPDYEPYDFTEIQQNVQAQAEAKAEKDQQHIELLKVMAEATQAQQKLAEIEAAKSEKRHGAQQKSAKHVNGWVIAGTWIAALSGLTVLAASVFKWF